MLPLVLNPANLRAGLVGKGTGLARRVAYLAEAGIEVRLLGDSIAEEELASLRLLFVTGLGQSEARSLADRARAMGVLVNVEDRRELCDFHVPAIVRRGELLLTISTGGRAPGLARLLREKLADLFGPEWSGRLNELTECRAKWQAQGLSTSQVSQNLRELLARLGWL